MQLHRLVYRSEAARLGENVAFEDLVASLTLHARRRNAEAGVTGAIMCGGGVFIQLIEGPLAAIEATFERICADLRHRQLQLIDFGCIETRAFPGQAMASVKPADGVLKLGAALSSTERIKVDPAGADALIDLMLSAGAPPPKP